MGAVALLIVVAIFQGFFSWLVVAGAKSSSLDGGLFLHECGGSAAARTCPSPQASSPSTALSADASRSRRIILTVPFIPREVPAVVDILLNKWISFPTCKEMQAANSQSYSSSRPSSGIRENSLQGPPLAASDSVRGPAIVPSSLDLSARQRYPSLDRFFGQEAPHSFRSGSIFAPTCADAPYCADSSQEPLALADMRSKFDLMFFSSVPLSRDQYAELEAAAKNSSAVRSCFARFLIVDAGLSKDEDIYPAGPSVMFFKLFLGQVTSLTDYGSMFWMEPDVTPLKPFWLSAVAREAHSAPFSWWMRGSIVHGPSANRYLLVPEAYFAWIKHINGNALYRLGDPDFVNFVQDRKSVV